MGEKVIFEEEIKDERELKIKALVVATELYCSPVANRVGSGKPSDILDTAEKIFVWLK